MRTNGVHSGALQELNEDDLDSNGALEGLNRGRLGLPPRIKWGRLDFPMELCMG